MKTLDEKKWKAQPITGLFAKFIPGKGKGLNHLHQGVEGVNYIGATNRGNGVLCVVVDDEAAHKLVQSGNCIGFIKNGDGAAGFAIYKKEQFISTSDVIYGYANWLNLDTGLFFVAAQDMIEAKYSHGYKRNQQHLRGDRVMLPVTDSGEPDYDYMAQYASKMRGDMLMRYKNYVAGQLSQLEYKEIPALNEKEWRAFSVESLFSTIEPTKGKTTSGLVEGEGLPYIAAAKSIIGCPVCSARANKEWASSGNGMVFVMLGDGAAGLAHYMPMAFIGMSGKTSVGYSEHLNLYNGLFIEKCLSSNKAIFSHGHSWTGKRLLNTKVMLPVTDSGEPDYAYMEQYAKNMMLRKYEQYLAFLDGKED